MATPYSSSSIRPKMLHGRVSQGTVKDKQANNGSSSSRRGRRVRGASAERNRSTVQPEELCVNTVSCAAEILNTSLQDICRRWLPMPLLPPSNANSFVLHW